MAELKNTEERLFVKMDESISKRRGSKVFVTYPKKIVEIVIKCN